MLDLFRELLESINKVFTCVRVIYLSEFGQFLLVRRLLETLVWVAASDLPVVYFICLLVEVNLLMIVLHGSYFRGEARLGRSFFIIRVNLRYASFLGAVLSLNCLKICANCTNVVLVAWLNTFDEVLRLEKSISLELLKTFENDLNLNFLLFFGRILRCLHLMGCFVLAKFTFMTEIRWVFKNFVVLAGLESVTPAIGWRSVFCWGGAFYISKVQHKSGLVLDGRRQWYC